MEEIIALVCQANRIMNDNFLSWEQKYDQIFDLHIARRMEEKGINLDYYDPDTDYEEDTRAYVAALNRKIANLNHSLADRHAALVNCIKTGVSAEVFAAIIGIVDWEYGDEAVDKLFNSVVTGPTILSNTTANLGEIICQRQD